MTGRRSKRGLAPDPRTVLTGLALVLCGRCPSAWPLLAVALIPWLSALDGFEGFGGCIAQGAWLAAVFTGGLFPWITGTTRTYLGLPAWASPLLFAVALPLCQPQLLLFPVLRRWLKRLSDQSGTTAATTAAILGSALLYAGLDGVAPKVFHDTLGHGLGDCRLLRQGADLGGAHLLTFVIVFLNEATWAFARRSRRRKAAPALALALASVIGLAAYGSLRLRQLRQSPSPGAHELKLALVQANSASARPDDAAAIPRQLDAYLRLSDEAITKGPRPDLVIWPESSFRTDYLQPLSLQAQAQSDRIEAWILRNRMPLAFGTYDSGTDGGLYNSMIAEAPGPPAAPASVQLRAYHKSLLFPIGENLPGFLARRLASSRPGEVEYSRGSGPALVEIPLATGKLPVCPLICYESIFPGYALSGAAQGGELFIDLTNDSWFDHTTELELHFGVARFRAIEARIPLIRAANTGITAVVSPDGEVVERLEPYRAGVLRATVTVGPAPWTLMKAWGDWFGPAALASGLLVLGALAFSQAALRRACHHSLNETASKGSVTIG